MQSFQEYFRFWVVCSQFDYFHVSIVFGFDDAFLLQYLEVAVNLVVSAVDDADKICDVGTLDLGESEQYLLSARRCDNLLQLQLQVSL